MLGFALHGPRLASARDDKEREARRAFTALETEMIQRCRQRLRAAGRRTSAKEAALAEHGRVLIERWQAYLRKYGDSAMALPAKNYLAQGYLTAGRPKAAESTLREMEKQATTVEHALMVAMGLRHLRDDPTAADDALDRFIARFKSDEKKAGAMLGKRLFVTGRRPSQRRAKRVEIARRVAQLYPKTEAGREAALYVRAAELAPGKLVIDMARFKDTDGKPLELEEYRGKVLLIDFWASWCGPCMRDLPELKRAYETFHADGFDILSISLDYDHARWSVVVKEQSMRWRHHFDGRGRQNEIAALYLVDKLPIPHTILVGPDGRVVAINPDARGLSQRVGKLLGKKGPGAKEDS
jgi:thiol-disulfide isomerase/thioredoxin